MSFLSCNLIFSLVILPFFVTSNFDGNDLDGSLTWSPEHVSCVRLFSNTFDIGCRTTSDSSIGALYEIRESNDLLNIPTHDIAIVVSNYLFTETINNIINRNNIKGVFVYDISQSNNISFSTDVLSPQGEETPQYMLTLNPSYAWNTDSSGFMYKSLKYVLYYIYI
jgi:hypothetical protein